MMRMPERSAGTQGAADGPAGPPAGPAGPPAGPGPESWTLSVDQPTAPGAPWRPTGPGQGSWPGPLPAPPPTPDSWEAVLSAEQRAGSAADPWVRRADVPAAEPPPSGPHDSAAAPRDADWPPTPADGAADRGSWSARPEPAHDTAADDEDRPDDDSERTDDALPAGATGAPADDDHG